MSSSLDRPIQQVSDTAFWVAYYRALETERADALFQDPLAKVLIDERAERIARSMKETGAHTRHNVLIRTVIIDRFVSELVALGVDTIVNLGAGLDTRPYRLNLPAELRWIEVDYPHLIEFKNHKLRKHSPRIRLERIAMDLSNMSERDALFTKISKESTKVAVITEGVLPYLTEAQVKSLAKSLHAQNNFQYWIADYISPMVYRFLKSSARQRQMVNAPFVFFPADWMGFFKLSGWTPTSVKYIPAESIELGRRMPIPWWSFILVPFLSRKIREGFLKASGYMILTKNL